MTGHSFPALVHAAGSASGAERSALKDTLKKIWSRSYLCYENGHWHDPEKEISEPLDLPENALPYLLFLLNDPEEDPRCIRDTVQGYVEFFAAVGNTLFSADQQRLMLPVLNEAEKRWPDRAEGFRALIRSIPPG